MKELSYIEKVRFVEAAKKKGLKLKPFRIIAPDEDSLHWEGISPGDIVDNEYEQAKYWIFMNENT